MPLHIRPDDLSSSAVESLLAQHMALMRSISPPESVHALDTESLRGPGISAYTAWRDNQLLGCGALKHLDDSHGEIKSMHTTRHARGQGIATAILAHLLGVCRQRGYQRVSLETGSMSEFAPARAMYEKHGFEYCEPFAQYRPDPHSVFMTLALTEHS